MRGWGIVTGYRIRAALVVAATLLVTVNGFALWGEAAALRLEAVLQVCITVGAIGYGLWVARRVYGLSRLWRLLAVAALVSLLAGETAWWNNSAVPAWSWVIPYWMFLVFGLASVVVLAIAGRGMAVAADGSLRHAAVVTVLDGGVAAAAFAILVAMGSYGTSSAYSWPRSDVFAVDVAYAVSELVVVVLAAVIATMYPADRPFRPNYLQLACGLVVVIASDRVVAYFDSIDEPGAHIWAGVGVVLGPLFIALSFRERNDFVRRTGRFQPMDWAQLTLPYAGFVGITNLLSYHVLTGHVLGRLVVATTLVMVILVAARQIVAMGAQRQLTNRLYDAQRRLGYQVLHDPLTGLPNRVMFAQRLDEAIKHGDFVLIFVDLDDFKEVNDRFGHAGGDELLCAVGERLSRYVRSNDTLARIGGDEFAILVDGVRDIPELVADRLRVALRAPFPIHGSSVRVSASMGLVRSGGRASAQTPDDLLRQADVSMYAGKRIGKDTAVVYQPSSGVRAEFPAVLREAKGGVPAGFSMAYQPVVRLPGQTPVALEALARWTAPNGIVVSPETFVAVAEAAGLGATLDAMVLGLACREISDAGLDVDIHVNVGAARLGNPTFEEQVRRTFDECGMAPSRLVLEITETVPIVDLSYAAAQIERFNDIGVRIALDDFGAGYNTLTYLHALPVDIVKLDRSLAVGADPKRDLAMYRSVVGLCTDLGMDVVAEGIETKLQADTVYAAGCRFAQGHLFGKPVPVEELDRDKYTSEDRRGNDTSGVGQPG
ncbi:GGDEF-domain containing protein [Mycolicibacterium parafortuitum]|uniref:GGDEF-domain containing protein n=1 Tax=Mycolicibacterium parafortuitum TaxID=39692 RepID=A0A7I7UE22_MYCPF|nr:EAL domain-containing protein [Mycolicibacterium parafortuitum]BBY78466.1 GGDEF-domain containing protein [Mycolicibacterium parafortuitum]